jgi:hypothetical protein
MKDFILACLMGAFFGIMFAVGFMDVTVLDLFNLTKGN